MSQLFHVQKREVNVVHCCLLPTSFEISSLCVLQVWKDMNWWQDFHFWLNCVNRFKWATLQNCFYVSCCLKICSNVTWFVPYGSLCVALGSWRPPNGSVGSNGPSQMDLSQLGAHTSSHPITSLLVWVANTDRFIFRQESVLNHRNLFTQLLMNVVWVTQST